MFFWVRALKVNLPAVTIEDAIRNYVKHNGHITGEPIDDKKIHSFAVEYDRWIKELYDHEKGS